ncbi:unnamed protein product [Lampetra planeri]
MPLRRTGGSVPSPGSQGSATAPDIRHHVAREDERRGHEVPRPREWGPVTNVAHAAGICGSVIRCAPGHVGGDRLGETTMAVATMSIATTMAMDLTNDSADERHRNKAQDTAALLF